MKYKINQYGEFSKSIIFWSKKFFYSKLTSLSNRHIKEGDKETLSLIFSALQKESIQENAELLKLIDKTKKILNEEGWTNKEILALSKLTNHTRKIGLIGINVYATPIIKLLKYLCDDKLVVDTIGKMRKMEHISIETLRTFLVIHCSNLSQKTKLNYRVAIHGLFSFIDRNNEDEDGRSFNFNFTPSDLILLSSTSVHKLPAYLNEDEIRHFLFALENIGIKQTHPFTPLPSSSSSFAPLPLNSPPLLKGRFKERDKLIIKIILYTGLRIHEVLTLKIRDVTNSSKHGQYIFNVVGKGNKRRQVMIVKELIEQQYKSWIKVRRSIEVKDNLLFCNDKGEEIIGPYIGYRIRKILEVSGLTKGKNGPHMLRHSFASLLYKKTTDLVLVQESLGHQDVTTSRVYTHLEKDKLIKASNIIYEVNKPQETKTKLNKTSNEEDGQSLKDSNNE